MLRTLHSTFGNSGASSYGESSSFGVSSGYGADASPYTGRPLNNHRVAMNDKRRGNDMGKLVVSCLVVILMGTVAVCYRSSYYSVLEELHTTQRAMTNVSLEYNKEESKNNPQMMIEQFGAEREYRVKRENTWQDQLSSMQHSIQRESWRTVMERFGEGPHHVTFTLKFYNEPEIEQTSSFKVELAPFHYMPHVNHFFLEQVYHELWDNTWFYINGPHVLQAGPQDWDEQSTGKAMDRFREARLDQLSFPEYHHEFPHVEWTLGFTGRPGGPEWYINKVDNSRAHGPGGQWHSHGEGLEEQADPCFAKVVEGHEVLQRIFHADVHSSDSEYPYLLREPVEILSARIDERVENKINKPEKIQNNPNGDRHHPQRTSINQETVDEEREKNNGNSNN